MMPARFSSNQKKKRRVSPSLNYVPFSRFDNGWNPDSDMDNVAPSELVEAKNCLPDRRGGISKRPGTTRLNAAYDANPIKRIMEVGKPGAIQFINASGVTLRKFDGTVIATGLANTDLCHEVWGTKTYFLNGDKYYVWDYTTWAEVTPNADPSCDLVPIKRCKYIAQRGVRLFTAGDPQNPNKLFLSEANDPTFFKGLSSVLAMTDDDDVITGLCPVGTGDSSAMVVFKNRSIFAWWGWDPVLDPNWHKQPASTGASSHYTIKEINGKLYYAGVDGVCRLYSTFPGQMYSECISDPSDNRAGVSKVLDLCGNKDKMVAEVWKNRYYLLSVDYGSTGSNNRVLVFDTVLDKWVGWFDIPASCWCLRKSTDELVFGSPTNGIIRKFGVGYSDVSDANAKVAIHMSAKTKNLTLAGDLGFHDDAIKSIFIIARQYLTESCTITATFKTDYVTRKYTIVTDESMIDGEGVDEGSIWGWIDEVTKEIVNPELKGKRTSITFENNTIDQPCTIYGVAFGARKKKPRATRLGITRVEVFE
jgi:hypothetical protein